MPLDYGDTDLMRNAIRDMRQHAIGDKVGLVMRWNKRDDMIWTVYTEFMNQPDPHNIQLAERRHFERVQGDYQEENETFTPTGTSTAQVGCHAEEILIVNWTWYELATVQLILANALVEQGGSGAPLQTERFALREVDLVLSKSPCHGPGGSQALQIGVHTYGTGCAMKLLRFCQEPRFRNVQWRIFYAALPPEKQDTRFEEIPQNLSRKEREKKENRKKDIEKNFKPQGQGPLVTRSEVPHSPFGSKIRLSLRGIALLNSVKNVTCEPL